MTNVSPVARMRGLAAAAMIGSDRSGSTTKSPESLLSHAAVAGAQARAGFRPRQKAAQVPVCPPDSTPVTGPAAMAMLMRLLDSPDSGLIEEWASLAHSRGQRIANHAVPRVLDKWSRQAQRASVVFTACGKPGEWLASLNPAWQRPVVRAEIPANADDIWQTGKTPERVAVLQTVRRLEPARALALVQSTWTSDGADERRRFVELLAERCSMADEPFLETSLDDKSKVVRRAAAALLVALPGSRLKVRMNERVMAIIAVEAKKGPFKKLPRVSLNPPQEFDTAWERDGIEEKAPGGTGKRAWWMRQLIGAADLSVWTDATGRDPEAVLKSIAEDDYFADALEGMRTALAVQGSAAWARAIFPHLLSGKRLDVSELGALCSGLHEKDREPLLLEAAANARFTAAEAWAVLATGQWRWSQAFSQKALAVLAGKAIRRSEWSLYEPVERISRAIAPELADEFAKAVEGLFPDGPTDSVKKRIDRVRLRAEMHKEFAT